MTIICLEFDDLLNIADDNESPLLITEEEEYYDRHLIHKRSNDNIDQNSVSFGENKIKYIIDQEFEYDIIEYELYFRHQYNHNEYNYGCFRIKCGQDEYKYHFCTDKTNHNYICDLLITMFAKYTKQKGIPFQIYSRWDSFLCVTITNAADRLIDDFIICPDIDKYIISSVWNKNYIETINTFKLHVTERISQININNKTILIFHAIMSSIKYVLQYGIMYDLLDIVYKYLIPKYMIMNAENIFNKIKFDYKVNK